MHTDIPTRVNLLPTASLIAQTRPDGPVPPAKLMSSASDEVSISWDDSLNSVGTGDRDGAWGKKINVTINKERTTLLATISTMNNYGCKNS